MTGLTIRVHGLPAPQGSKRHVGNGVMVESSKAVKPWREAVKWAALEAMYGEVYLRDRGTANPAVALSGPLRVVASFMFVRPRGHYGTGRNANRLRNGAPPTPAIKPDLDKLLRSTFDALTDAGVWKDDGQVVRVSAWKAYSETAGALLLVYPDPYPPAVTIDPLPVTTGSA